jgi:Spy/CpxP family protein refolding chaperone
VTDIAAGASAAGGMRRRWPIVLLAVSLALNLCFIAGAGWVHWHAPPGPEQRLKQVVRELKLDPNQNAAFQSYVRTIRARAMLMREETEPLITGAWEELAKPQPDQTRAMQLFDQVAEKRRAMLRETATETANLLASLSPEQREKFIAIWRQRRVPLWWGPRPGTP